MDADELIARLAAEGELDSTGSFTIDPAAALEKLREFQLRDPTRFVLSWVRAATLLGASRIDIEIDADDVWVRFDGEALSTADFEALWSSVVGRRGSARVRACRELALGINGAFTWEAKSVDVRSGELQVGFDRSFAMSNSRVSTPAGPRNSIHAKRPIGWDLVRRRMLDGRGELPEELLLAHACALGAVPIYLEGKRLNPEREEPSDVWLRIAIDDDERRGWLRLRPGERSQLRVLVAGVEVALVELPFGAGWVDALVDDPLLPLDLSQEKPVEDERWQALLDCVSRARWWAWFILATREDWPPAHGNPRLASKREPDADALIQDIFASDDASWIAVPGAMTFADRLVLERAVSNPEGDIRPLAGTYTANGPPILPWPGEPAGALTLGEVVRSGQRGVLFSSPTALPELGFVPQLPVLLHASSVGLRALGHVVLDRPGPVARYHAMLAELRPLSGERPLPEAWLSQHERHDDLHVRVAWKRGAMGGHGAMEGHGVLVIGREGKCLARHGLPPSWGPLWIEAEGPFPSEPGPELDELLATAVLAGLSRHHDLLAALDGERLSEHEREVVAEYLAAACGRWSMLRLGELRNISIESRRRALERWRGSWGVPAAWVDPPAHDRGPCDHPLMDLAWLERGGQTLSLRDVQREVALAAGGVLRWLAPSDTDPAPSEVWRLTPSMRAVLAAVFPGALERFDHRAWQRRELGPHTVPESLPEARLSLALAGAAGEHGVLGLAPRQNLTSPWPRLPARGARLRLLGSGHELGWMDVSLPVGSFYGVIEVPHASAVAHGDVARKDEAWRAAAAVVEAGALALARTQLEDWIASRHEPDDRSRVDRWMIDLEHGGWPTFAAALASWQATLGPEHPLRVLPKI
jgi:hypothetical protein